jgi:hypothetical protein
MTDKSQTPDLTITLLSTNPLTPALLRRIAPNARTLSSGLYSPDTCYFAPLPHQTLVNRVSRWLTAGPFPLCELAYAAFPRSVFVLPPLKLLIHDYCQHTFVTALSRQLKRQGHRMIYAHFL